MCAAAPGRWQLDDVVDRLARRYADRTAVHRDVIEAAVRSGWAKYADARVPTYRTILAERAAIAALQPWFGAPRSASAYAAAEPAASEPGYLR
jgi:hypothetical protein